MTRLADHRDTHLTADEIAIEALRQFDADGPEPSIRSLARKLRVTPSAIYHHHASHARIVQAAIDLIWEQAANAVLAQIPDPFTAEPREVLFAAGIETRRAFRSHPRAAQHVAADWNPSAALTAVLGLMANLFERLGLTGTRFEEAFHGYSSFVLGNIVLVAARNTAWTRRPEEQSLPYAPAYDAEARSFSSDDGRRRINAIMSLSAVDPERDEQLFAQGLRRVIAGLTLDD
ncbi:MAG: TetR/AcrR family transcriptional regulator [Patulibacter sp.]|nr:TetR/AcrR family transcriptional regulator [Patulibacter sp.]